MRKRKTLFFPLIMLLTVGMSSCSSLLFYPTHVLYYDPAAMKLTFDEVRIPSYDGSSLYGWYFHHDKGSGGPKDSAKGVIFFAHGNGENLSSHFTALTFVLPHGYDFFIFDYRGYGVSTGDRPNTREGVGDTIAALRWTDKKAKELHAPLVVFGQSLGSALLMRALIEEREEIHPAFIGLESPFLSYQWAAASVLSQHLITTLLQPLAFALISDKWAPGARIRELRPTPILIMHGDQDRVIDYRLGVETFDRALPPKEFVKIPGGGHIQAFWGREREKFRTLFLEKMDTALQSH